MDSENMKKKTVDKKKNIHAGHRGRLLELVMNAGIENLSEVQALEFFLTYIFPRGDTNPLAHRLLDEYGSFSNVLEADPDDLIHVEGINKRSASMLASFKELFFYFYSCRSGKKCKVSNLPELLDIVEDNLRFRTTEHALLLGLSAADMVVRKKIFSSQNSGQVGIPTSEITRFISTAQPASIVIAHCHPYGRAIESENDARAFAIINNLCNSCGVKLIDSYIVGEDGIYSQRFEDIVRGRHDVAELANDFNQILKG